MLLSPATLLHGHNEQSKSNCTVALIFNLGGCKSREGLGTTQEKKKMKQSPRYKPNHINIFITTTMADKKQYSRSLNENTNTGSTEIKQGKLFIKKKKKCLQHGYRDNDVIGSQPYTAHQKQRSLAMSTNTNHRFPPVPGAALPARAPRTRGWLSPMGTTRPDG